MIHHLANRAEPVGSRHPEPKLLHWYLSSLCLPQKNWKLRTVCAEFSKMDRFASVWLLPLWLSVERLGVAKKLIQAWSDECKTYISYIAAAAQTHRGHILGQTSVSVCWDRQIADLLQAQEGKAGSNSSSIHGPADPRWKSTALCVFLYV